MGSAGVGTPGGARPQATYEGEGRTCGPACPSSSVHRDFEWSEAWLWAARMSARPPLRLRFAAMSADSRAGLQYLVAVHA
jgi:hypothetical protein